MDDQNFIITIYKDIITLIFEKEVLFRNFFFVSETIRSRIKENKKCVVDVRQIIYCNSSCIAFLFSIISFMNKENISYEIKTSEYVDKIFSDLNVRKIIKI
jgi:ABC-type transporter Mla MlaB component